MFRSASRYSKLRRGVCVLLLVCCTLIAARVREPVQAQGGSGSGTLVLFGGEDAADNPFGDMWQFNGSD